MSDTEAREYWDSISDDTRPVAVVTIEQQWEELQIGGE